MRGQLEVAGADWQKKQYAAAIWSELPPLLRSTDFYQGRLIEQYFLETVALIQNAEPWHALPRCARTQRHITIGFAMVARALGGVNQLLYSWQTSYPVLLFGLLTDDAVRIAIRLSNEPECLLDNLTKGLRKRYCTAALLLSEDCESALVVRTVFRQAISFEATVPAYS